MRGPGFRLGRYELLARIATGGMGEIFLARLGGVAGFEKLFVIKRILPHLADDERFRAMLIGEAQVVANMSHANICQVYELDETDGQLFIVMEYLEGVTLLGLLRRFAQSQRALDLGFIAGVVQQVCEGLHYAHELRSRDGELLRIIHRDVTPSNIFLTKSGVVKVHDFGVAKVKNAASTESGAVKGKHAYSAPEQLRGAVIDRKVDVFALGVVTYELLAARPLFQRKTDFLTFQAVMRRPLPPLRRSHVPPAVASVLERALALEPVDRFATAREAGAAIVEALLGGEQPWSQVEIGELVNREFGEEIHNHNVELDTVLEHSGRDTSLTMPVMLQNPSDPDDGDYFAIETGVDTSDPIAQGSQPIGAVGSAPSVASAPPRRAWPYAAILCVAAAAGGTGVAAVDRLRDAPAAPAARAAPSEPYASALHDRRAALARCSGDLPAGATARIVVGLDGRASRVELAPAVMPAPLARCIEEALAAVQFPTAGAPKQLTLALRVL
jgi:eukaryotic-like serine/threonine-protein kinase